MSLTIVRETPATDSLVTFTETTYSEFFSDEQTVEWNYKASDLVEIIITQDKADFLDSQISIQMQQKIFKSKVRDLNINNNEPADIDELRFFLQPVFLDSNTGGGGGGTTDNSTPPHFIYKALDGTFRDTPMIYDEGTDKTTNNAVEQEENMVSGTGVEHQISKSSVSLVHLFSVAATLQKYMELKKLDGDISEDFTFLLGQEKVNMLMSLITGGEANSSIIIGDINNTDTDAPQIIWDFLTNNLTLKAKSLLINGIDRMALGGLQTFANNAAAISGGFSVDSVYKTATGELRIVV